MTISDGDTMQMNVEGVEGRKATMNIIPRETVISALDLEYT